MQLFFNILDIASYVIGGIAVIGILYILVKKFGVVASIDIDSIPKHQQGAVRQQLAAQRLKRKFEKAGGFMNRILRPALSKVYQVSKNILQRLIKIEQRTSLSIAKRRSEKKGSKEEITQLQERAEKAAEAEDFSDAEQKYIEMISLNPRSVEAYKNLGDLYMEMKEYKSALETYTYIISLEKKQDKESSSDIGAGSALADHYAHLARASIGLEDWHRARTNIDEALKFEPNNPKYLDLLFTTSIQLKDTARADEALTRLKEVNPENKKLEEFIDQLARLEK